MIANNVGAGVLVAIVGAGALVAIVGAGALVAIATAVWFKWIEARHDRAFAEQGERLNAGLRYSPGVWASGAAPRWKTSDDQTEIG
jgi:hypothetical protein